MQVIANNTANFAGGSQIKVSYKELIAPDKSEKNSKEAQEIIDALKEKMSKLGGGNGECF